MWLNLRRRALANLKTRAILNLNLALMEHALDRLLILLFMRDSVSSVILLMSSNKYVSSLWKNMRGLWTEKSFQT